MLDEGIPTDKLGTRTNRLQSLEQTAKTEDRFRAHLAGLNTTKCFRNINCPIVTLSETEVQSKSGVVQEMMEIKHGAKETLQHFKVRRDSLPSLLFSDRVSLCSSGWFGTH